MTTERVCACGCGRSLEGAVANQKWHKSCAGKRWAEMKRGYNRKERARQRESLSNARASCGIVTRRDGSPPRKAQPMSCQTCCDLPWRRDRPRCSGCRELYRPEPTETIQGQLSSSASLALAYSGG